MVRPSCCSTGSPDSAYLWRKQIPALVGAGRKVIAYGQRGFGESDVPRGKRWYSLDRARDDAIALLDHLQIEKVSVVGHDFGAVVGWLLAMDCQDRVDRLVAISVGHPTAYAQAGIKQKLLAWYALFVPNRITDCITDCIADCTTAIAWKSYHEKSLASR